VYANWQNTVTAGGHSVSDNVRLRGVNHEFLAITNAHLASGRMLTPYHIAARARVCLVGSELAVQLFQGKAALGEMVTVAVEEQRSFPCTIIGVMKPQHTREEWAQPNMQILVPYTLFQATASYWSSRLSQFSVQVQADVESAAKKLKAYFDQRYGNAGRFSIDTEGTLVAQTKRFLNIFAALIAAIAFLSLLVGGIGIHNMMLVSVTERIKEIGLRKALGATSRSIKIQVLMESLVLCTVAGVIGIGAGFAVTELMIYAATKFVSGLAFEWVIDPWALAVSVGSIICVGLFSGMVPALRAEKLQVIEALRAE
jgi:putative ABC transport system permease protein